MSKKHIKIIVGFFLSLLAIIGIVYFVDLDIVWLNLRKLSWKSIVIISLLYIANIMVRTYRWRLIISTRELIKFNTIFKGIVYGFMLNQLLPAKAGEVARAEYVARNASPGRSFLLGSIVAERIFDMIVIILFLGISVIFSQTIMEKIHSQWIVFLILFIGLIVILLLLNNVNYINKVIRFLPESLRKFIDRVLINIAQSFQVFSSFRLLIRTFLLTLLIWLLTCLVFYIIIQDLEISVPFYTYFFIVSAGTFGMIIPSTSANVGVYHAVAMGALMLFMVPKEQALSFAILAHALDFIPAVVLGLGFIGISEFKKIIKK